MKNLKLSILFFSLLVLSSCTKEDPKTDITPTFPEIEKISETESFGTMEITDHNILNGVFNFVANSEMPEYDNFKGAHYAVEGQDFIQIKAESVSENKEHFISCTITLDEVSGVGNYPLSNPQINRVDILVYRFIEGENPISESNILADLQSVDGSLTLREWNENGGIFSQGIDLTFDGTFEDDVNGEMIEINSARILFQ